jgi:hypothetical protein
MMVIIYTKLSLLQHVYPPFCKEGLHVVKKFIWKCTCYILR